MHELQHIFYGLSDGTRLHIVELLQQYENICVSELAAALSISSAAVSQHMRMLEFSGIIRKERVGRKSCYQLQTENPIIADVLAIIYNREAMYEY